MSEDRDLSKGYSAQLPIRPFVIAALYAAAIVGIGMFFVYGGGEYGIGQIAGIVAFGVALFWALILSPIFYFARSNTTEVPYFLLHLGVGVSIGAIRAASNPYASTWTHYVYNHDALLVSCASMAAWLYVVLQTPPGSTRLEGRSKASRAASPVVLILGLALLPIAIISTPIPVDPSCHNVFRGGRTSAAPAILLNIRVPDSDKAELGALYDSFAEDFDLSIRGHRQSADSTSRSICNDDVVISAGGTHPPDGRHTLSFFQHISGTGWEPLASELICRIEAKWSDSMTFSGRGGEDIPKPAIVAKDCIAPPSQT
ncbi:MAG: hypothetical protein QNJ14_03990 [Woeseiaceae bacterium]|nr:hypothetical protein [Woeseiaceae bacterium]